MNPIDFAELLNELPDDMICSANDADYRKRHRISYIISALAASVVLIISAAFYLKLRTEKPSLLLRSDSENQPSEEYQTTTDSAESHTDVTTISVSGNQEDVQSTSESTVFASATRDTINSTTTAAENTESSLTTAFTTSQTTGSVTSVSNTERTSGTKATVTTEGDITTIAEKTTDAESEDITTDAQDCSYTDTTYTEGTKSDSDDSLTSWVISCRTVDSSAETPDFDVHAVLYRDFIPDAVLSAGLQNADWKTNDCLIIRFQTTGYGNGLAEMIGGTGMLYGLTIIPPAAPVDFVKEYIIAVSVPKKLYHPASPDGINRWLCSDEPVPATDRMQCMLLRYDE